MTVIIGIFCFSAGSLFGVALMCILSAAKQADKEMEDDHGT